MGSALRVKSAPWPPLQGEVSPQLAAVTKGSASLPPPMGEVAATVPRKAADGWGPLRRIRTSPLPPPMGEVAAADLPRGG